MILQSDEADASKDLDFVALLRLELQVAIAISFHCG